MHARIVTVPEAKVAVIAHRGSPDEEHATALRLVSWKIERRQLLSTALTSVEGSEAIPDVYVPIKSGSQQTGR